MAKEAKLSKTYRLPKDTISQIEDLETVFNESGAEVVARAIQFLSDERNLAIEHEREKLNAKKAS
ncbi:hypothetical protein [Fibrella aestuarina]|uniref:hypothetical protein n=1 Tax=Fibrella aestuarina TaxID=651143 RepID=UPI0002DFB095|nr:hypothetical protein [Fibrella aestuarina]